MRGAECEPVAIFFVPVKPRKYEREAATLQRADKWNRNGFQADIIYSAINRHHQLLDRLRIAKAPPAPKRQVAGPDLMITWVVDHSKTPLAPKNETAKKYAEAERLLKQVIARHPKTPWADLAQDALNRGLSVQLNEWHHNPKYYERAQFVPEILSLMLAGAGVSRLAFVAHRFRSSTSVCSRQGRILEWFTFRVSVPGQPTDRRRSQNRAIPHFAPRRVANAGPSSQQK